MNNEDLNSIIKDFPERENEILELDALIDPILVPSPPILIYGPSASGKNKICIEILNKLKIPYCKILCLGYSSSKQLFRAIYNSAVSVLLPNSNDFFNHLLRKVEAFKDGQNFSKLEKFNKQRNLRKINNISDLCHGLAELIGNEKDNANRKTKLYLMFSYVSTADKYEKNLSNKLLRLSEMSSPSIRVIGITRDSLNIPQFILPVKFSPYTDIDLKNIILNRADKEMFLNRNTSGDYLKKRKNFVDVLSESYPLLSISTRHIEEIWSMIVIIWKNRLNCLEKNVQFESTANIISSIKKRASINMYTSSDKAIDLVSLKVENWLASLPISTLFILISSYICSKNPSWSDNTTLGIGTKGKKRKTQAGSMNQENDEESNLFKDNHSENHRPIPLDRIFCTYMLIITRYSSNSLDELSLSYKSSDDTEAYSIYNEINKNGQKVIRDYGDSYLISTVSTLVSLGLLIQTSSWSLSTPSYYCAIDNETAEEISKYLKFPLNEHLNY